MRSHESTTKMKMLFRVLGLSLVAFTVACSAGSPTDTSLGMLRLSLTDAPTDELTKVVVALRDVTVTDTQGNVHQLAAAIGGVDLLQLRDAQRLLGSIGVNPGSYTALTMSFDPDNSWVETLAGTRVPLATPLGEIVIEGSFDVRRQMATDVLLDFDADQSLYKLAEDDWLLDPVVFVKDVSVG